MIEPIKYAVVTGASSGIGWHLSIELAKRGYSIVAVSNQAERLGELKIQLTSRYEVFVHLIDCDLTEPSSAQNIFDYCDQKNLNIEVLVNNAGMLVYGEVTDIEMETTREILQLHMNTPALLCRLFSEQMKSNGKGFILNVSSISAVMPYPTISLYGPTKTFLRKYTRALRIELYDSGVWVNCLLPGATATALYDTDKVNIPLALRLGVMKKPEEVARKGVEALFKNKAECIPGFLNKFTMFLVRIVPYSLIVFIHRKVNR